MAAANGPGAARITGLFALICLLPAPFGTRMAAADMAQTVVGSDAVPTPAPASLTLEPVTIAAERLQAINSAIEPRIGASTYTITTGAIEAQPGGANNTLNQVLLQTPGVTQDAQSAGGIHVRNEMQPVEFRINGITLPAGLSFFGQGLSPRFADTIALITGALPAQYGLSTSGIVDIQTKTGLFAPGGVLTMYGGGNQTFHPSAEYGGSIDGYNFYFSGDFLRTDRGIDAVTPASAQIHDHSVQQRGFPTSTRPSMAKTSSPQSPAYSTAASRSRTTPRPRLFPGWAS
jgi:hypothetical protein